MIPPFSVVLLTSLIVHYGTAIVNKIQGVLLSTHRIGLTAPAFVDSPDFGFVPSAFGGSWLMDGDFDGFEGHLHDLMVVFHFVPS